MEQPKKRISLNSNSEKVEKSSERELKCIMGFFRHSERTPKQKIKIKINHESPLFTLIKGDKQVKLKTPEKLRQVKELVTESLGMLNKKSFNWEDLDDESEKKLENLIHD